MALIASETNPWLMLCSVKMANKIYFDFMCKYTDEDTKFNSINII